MSMRKMWTLILWIGLTCSNELQLGLLCVALILRHNLSSVWQNDETSFEKKLFIHDVLLHASFLQTKKYTLRNSDRCGQMGQRLSPERPPSSRSR